MSYRSNPRRGSKPGERRGGRQKGTANKITCALKEMILQALANVGGTAYLEQQAAKNPVAFLTLVRKVLPLQVKDHASDPIVPRPVVHEHVSG